jgi:hypothetical protein
MRSVLMTLLIFEVMVFGLAVPVMIFLGSVSGATAGLLGGGAAVLALVSAGLLRRPAGYLLGWVTQIVGVALGFVTNAMFAVGGLFLLLWVVSFVLGRRLDAMRQPPAAA